MSPIHYCRENPCPICCGTVGPGRVTEFSPVRVVSVYPCDRGIPDNVTGRGWHHFEASPNGVIVCRYCGRKP